MADLSVVIGADDTAEDVGGFDPSRKALRIFPAEANTDNGWIRFGDDATQANPSIPLLPGVTYEFGTEWREQIVRRISIIGKQDDVFTITTSSV
jgi:hypothetical protein